ncbi:hypothetical protein [Marinobacter sp.]|uniref:hypothetical protein n=1 Tax=Marinobacter sp. TaxID=50741 RepID=UPI00384B3CF5
MDNTLTLDQRHFIATDLLLAPLVVNILVAWGLAWLIFSGSDAIVLWGPASVGEDTIATTFTMPLINTLIVATLTRRAAGSGRIPRVEPERLRGLGWLPDNRLLRALLLAAISLCTAGPIAVVVLTNGFDFPMDVQTLLIWKVAMAVVMAPPLSLLAGLPEIRAPRP